MPVILFHAGLDVFSGGFVGVDVFFVISGYLITTIILTRIEGPGFSLLDFYARRARRILPALALVVAVTTPFAWAWMLPTEFKDYAQSIAAVSLFSSNFLFWIESGYFAAAAENKPLLHTWSLAVEEQYYIFFPLLLMAFWRRHSQVTTVLLVAIFLASLVTSEVLWRVAPDANFYLLPSRAWELMVGSLCAVFTLRRGQQANNPLSALGLGLIVVAIFVFDGTTPFPSLWALVPVLGTGLVLIYGTKGTYVAWILSRPVPVGIGLISYSAYLWHQPLLALARLRDPLEPAPVLMIGLGLLSLPLAYMSWRFVEQPARRAPAQAWKVVLGTAAGSATLFGLAAMLSVSSWQADYFRASLSPQNHDLLARIVRVQQMDHNKTVDAGDCRYYIRTFDAAAEARFDACAEVHGKALVVFGDSHSMDVYKGLVAAMDHPFLIGFPQGPCRPHVAKIDCSETELTRFLTSRGETIGMALYVQAGFWLFTDSEGQEHARRLFADRHDVDAQLNVPAIDRALGFLTQIQASVPAVTWLGPRIEPHVSMDSMLGLDCDLAASTLHLHQRHLAAFQELDAYLAQATAQAGIPYLSEQAAMQFDLGEDLYSCDALYWSDSDHWSPAGEATFGARLAPVIRAALAQQPS